jgi:hypothetical protein
LNTPVASDSILLCSVAVKPAEKAGLGIKLTRTSNKMFLLIIASPFLLTHLSSSRYLHSWQQGAFGGRDCRRKKPDVSRASHRCISWVHSFRLRQTGAVLSDVQYTAGTIRSQLLEWRACGGSVPGKRRRGQIYPPPEGLPASGMVYPPPEGLPASGGFSCLWHGLPASGGFTRLWQTPQKTMKTVNPDVS